MYLIMNMYGWLIIVDITLVAPIKHMYGWLIIVDITLVAPIKIVSMNVATKLTQI